MAKWQTELQTAIRDFHSLAEYLEEEIEGSNFPVLVPKNLAEQVKIAGKDSALWKQYVPSKEELGVAGTVNPIGDLEHGIRGQLIHRYKNRLLLLPTSNCPVHCRYCFRQNEINDSGDLFKKDITALSSYLEKQKGISEVIFSGGDPFVLSNGRIAEYIEALTQYKNIKYVRFHTRTPIVLPSRFDQETLYLLKNLPFKRVTMVAHINHISELNSENLKKLSEIKNSVPHLLSQSVLLKGVNDSASALAALFEKLSDIEIRPYYLHHPDLVKGGAHFYLEQREGAKIYQELRQLLPGWAIPQYVYETPNGGGKSPVPIN